MKLMFMHKVMMLLIYVDVEMGIYYACYNESLSLMSENEGNCCECDKFSLISAKLGNNEFFKCSKFGFELSKGSFVNEVQFSGREGSITLCHTKE